MQQNKSNSNKNTETTGNNAASKKGNKSSSTPKKTSAKVKENKTAASAGSKNQEQNSEVDTSSSQKQDRNNQNQPGKNQKGKIKGSTIAMIILAIFLVLSMATIGTLSYFVARKTSRTSFTIGDEVTIAVMENGSSAFTITYPRNTIPGMTYQQPIILFQPNNTSPTLVRAKVSLVTSAGDSVAIKMVVPQTWTVGEDGYYYYNGSLLENTTTEFSSAMEIPKALESGEIRENCVVTVVVEAIHKASGMVPQLWTTAPSGWIENYAR